MPLRKNAHWMKQQDDRILEYLDREGWASASLIASEASIDISEGHLNDRLRMLWYAGLVSPTWSDAYEITTLGALYLRGELDAEHLPRPTIESVSQGLERDGGHTTSGYIS
jgi:hypothetical protein